MGKRKEPGGEKRRGSPVIGWIIIIASVAACFFSYLKWDENLSRRSVLYIEGIGERLQPPASPLRIEILSLEGGSIKARLALRDRAGGEIAMIEKSWPGSVLSVDAVEVPLRGSKQAKGGELWLAFPCRIYTDALPPSEGYSLFASYDSSGFPSILEGVAWTVAERASLTKAFDRAKRNLSSKLPDFGTKIPLGALSRKGARLQGLGIGKAYDLYFGTEGSISIRQASAR
jgi:hypothetical protein